mmetsp:Transcript_61409/g.139016  ORF Transcript_61409/g.139016 Transcript_61409/m.139016 type:complete len:104 (+) Transcript_61409:320-631(+)
MRHFVLAWWFLTSELLAEGNSPSQDCSALPDHAFIPITLTNNQGLSLSFIPYGGTVTRLRVLDASGRAVDVVLGFDDPREYCANDQVTPPASRTNSICGTKLG